jgi:hypothetical protein
MKPGELVELSAYAKKLKMFRTYRDRIGLLVDIQNEHICGDYLVKWHGMSRLADFSEGLGFGETQLMQRKDIKKVK